MLSTPTKAGFQKASAADTSKAQREVMRAIKAVAKEREVPLLAVLETLGSGAHGEVKLCRHEASGRLLAMKVVRRVKGRRAGRAGRSVGGRACG